MNKKMITRFALVAMCLTGVANAAVITHTAGLAGVLSGNSPTGATLELPQVFVDPADNSTVNFNLVVALDWVDSSGASVAGLSGSVFGNATGLGANTQSGINPGDSGAVEAVTLAAGGQALERLTFSVSGLTNGYVFTGFSNPTGNLNDETFSGSTVFSITPGQDGYRVNGIEANFEAAEPNAVPEPGTWMMFGVLGMLLATRAVRGRQEKE